MTEEKNEKNNEESIEYIDEDVRKREVVSSYNREYWKRNREKLLKRKKERYQTDTEYRSKVIQFARERKIRLREARRKEKLDGDLEARGFNKNKIIIDLPGGNTVEVEAVTVGGLSEALCRSKKTIKKWEDVGIIPEALYRDNNYNRLYTKFQVRRLSEILEDECEKSKTKSPRKKVRIKSTNFRARALRFWEDYPYGIDLNETE